MSNPNPLIPQGTFQAKAARSNSNIRIAVATIVAIHLVFFGGLLLQGCKRESASETASTNTTATETTNASLTLPPLDTSTNSLYYTNPNSLPTERAATIPTSNVPGSVYDLGSNQAGSQLPQDLWSTPATNPVRTPSPAEPVEVKEYTVVRGDSYYKIAKAYGTTVAALQQANPGIEPTRIQPGMKLKIPAKTASPEVETNGGGGSFNGGGNVYTVKAGDNLTKIARQYGVTISELRSANGLRTSQLKVGQKLKIPGGRQGNGTTEPRGQSPTPELGF